MTSQTPPARHFCLTFFKIPRIELPNKVRYAIYGEEKCPETETTHWQSYVELFKPARFATIKKMYTDDTIHIEVRKGTREQARNYCKKDEKWAEHGVWIEGQGSRTDLAPIMAELASGSTIGDIMLEHPEVYCRYRNGLKDVAAEYAKRASESWREVEVILHTGPTGIGKTRHAMTEATYKIQGSQLKWWQDYQGEKVICIDEYNNNVPIDELLALLDGYTLRLDVKGSNTYAQWTKVLITTNLRKEEIHPQAKDAHRAALFRRITSFVNAWPTKPEWNPFVFTD